jgi:phosphatidylinositol alpha-mannosyltransferase
MVSDSEKWELMTHAKIYLAPALYGESFGIVLLEAMIVGTPVVGYANSGYKSVIAGYFDEQFVEPGRIDKLQRVVSELLIDETKLLKLSQKGLECSKKFSWDRIIEDYIQIYLKY